jgi:hypothetical protein
MMQADSVYMYDIIIRYTGRAIRKSIGFVSVQKRFRSSSGKIISLIMGYAKKVYMGAER